MSNSVFEALSGGKPQQGQPTNPMQMVQKIRSDPTGFLRQSGYNIPDGMNDPQQIISHLLQSGQVQPNKYRQVLGMLGGPRR